MATVTCTHCRTHSGPEEYFFRAVHGYELPRAQGGANQITMRRVIPDSFVCQACMGKLKANIDPAQGGLFE